MFLEFVAFDFAGASVEDGAPIDKPTPLGNITFFKQTIKSFFTSKYSKYIYLSLSVLCNYLASN